MQMLIRVTPRRMFPGYHPYQVRVIEEDTFVETIKESPAPNLKKIFREEMTKARTPTPTPSPDQGARP